MTWDEKCHAAAGLFEQGQHEQARDLFEELASDEAQDQFGRAMMCLNLALVETKIGSNRRAKLAYERGAGLALYSYLLVQNRRIEWLVEHDELAEAEDVVTKLLALGELLEEDRRTCKQHLKAIQERRRGQAL